MGETCKETTVSLGKRCKREQEINKLRSWSTRKESVMRRTGIRKPERTEGKEANDICG